MVSGRKNASVLVVSGWKNPNICGQWEDNAALSVGGKSSIMSGQWEDNTPLSIVNGRAMLHHWWSVGGECFLVGA